MTCAEFEEVLPDVLDGSRDLEVEAHLKACPKCWELLSDLRAITEECKLLRASEEPPSRVWNSIENTLRAEGLIRESERPFLIPAPSTRRWGAAWLVPVAAALAVGIAFFVAHPLSDRVAQQSNPSPQVVVPTPDVSGSSSSVEDDQQVMASVSQDAPMMEASYQENLRSVNNYINDAEQFLKQHPDDNEARQYLMEARRQKQMLYEMALDRSLP